MPHSAGEGGGGHRVGALQSARRGGSGSGARPLCKAEEVRRVPSERRAVLQPLQRICCVAPRTPAWPARMGSDGAAPPPTPPSR